MTNLMSERARRMRREKGAAERRLWYRLRELNRQGFQFRQQAPVGPYIADFCDHSAKLVVELDGAQHGESKGLTADKRRTRWLESQGYKVLRFWNHEVLTNIHGVEVAIMLALGLLAENATADPSDARVPFPLVVGKEKVCRVRQRVSCSVPSPLVGEGKGGGIPEHPPSWFPPPLTPPHKGEGNPRGT